MQFKIPQDVQRPDTIIGPITFAQLGTLLVGGAIDYAIYMALANTYYWYVWAGPVSIIGLITIAIAFLKIGDMTFSRFIIYYIEFMFKPRDRFWSKNDEYYYSVLKKPILIADVEDKHQQLTEDELREKRKKLQEISKILDQ
jgi:hypothetical protein